MSVDRNWTEIVLTGGPCAGKSSALAHLVDKLGDRDIRVLCVPELPTQLIAGGIADLVALAADQREVFLAVEEQILRMHADQRRAYRALARAFAPQQVAIIYDRGAMDVAAYTSEDEFSALLERTGMDLHDVRDSYDCVLHLVTAADGAEQFYTTANNAARSETPEQARAGDRRCLAVWTGSPHLHIIGNQDTFARKLDRALTAVLNTLGLPGLEVERKWLLNCAPAPDAAPLRDAVAVDIEQTYLTAGDGGVERRVRRRAQGDSATFFYTEKADDGSGARVERERIITAREYATLLVDADPALRTITKTRFCFAHRSHHFELDRIQRVGRDPLWMLEVELLDADEPVQLPAGLQVGREVTDDRAFRNAAIAAQEAAR